MLVGMLSSRYGEWLTTVLLQQPMGPVQLRGVEQWNLFARDHVRSTKIIDTSGCHALEDAEYPYAMFTAVGEIELLDFIV
jgi:hypothetical protein